MSQQYAPDLIAWLENFIEENGLVESNWNCLLSLVKQQNETTTWTLVDEDANAWSCSTCDALWVFLDGGPVENETQFCPQCGRRLEVIDHDEA